MRRFLSSALFALVLITSACGGDDTASPYSTITSTNSTTTEAVSVDDTTSTMPPSSTTTSAPSSTTTLPEWPGASFSPSALPDVLIAHDDVYVTLVSGLAVVTAWSDLTEWVGYRSATGAVELPTPTEGIEYNGPPYVTAATLSSDATIVYWAEGPDWGYDTELNDSAPMPAEWRVKAMPLATGEIVLDFPVSEVVVDNGELTISSLHHTGEHLIINRAAVLDGRWVDLRPLVLDFSFEEPDLYELPLLGTATPLSVD